MEHVLVRTGTIDKTKLDSKESKRGYNLLSILSVLPTKEMWNSKLKNLKKAKIIKIEFR